MVAAAHVAAAAANAAEAAGAGSAPSCSNEGSGSLAEVRLPVLQARRPASIATGRQWVLPEGWPLPLTTEVRGGIVECLDVALLPCSACCVEERRSLMQLVPPGWSDLGFDEAPMWA